MRKGCFKYIIAFILTGVSLWSKAEQINVDSINKNTQQTVFVKLSFIQNTDPYLSPLKYKGKNIIIGSCWKKKLARTKFFNQLGYIQLGYYISQNTYSKNTEHGINLNVAWGTMYNCLSVKQKLKIGIGPMICFDYLGKLLVKNINKPYSMDIGLDLGNLLQISYATYIKNKNHSIKISYRVFNNLIGIGYSPNYWQSYYEITEGVKGKTALTSFVNRLNLKQVITFDFQLKKFSGCIGFEHNFLKYNYKNYDNTTNSISFILGYNINYKIIHKSLTYE